MPEVHASVLNAHNALVALQTYTALAHAGVAAAGGWGFVLCLRQWGEGQRELLGALTARDSAVYTGQQAVYFCLFGLLGIMSEVRTEWMREKILRRIGGILDTFVGRACFALYVGSSLLLIPWDGQMWFVSKVPAGGLILAALLQAGVAVCGPRRPDEMITGGTSRRKKGSSKSTAETINWGTPASPMADGGVDGDGGGGGDEDGDEGGGSGASSRSTGSSKSTTGGGGGGDRGDRSDRSDRVERVGGGGSSSKHSGSTPLVTDGETITVNPFAQMQAK
jgi:hypothetical protein